MPCRKSHILISRRILNGRWAVGNGHIFAVAECEYVVEMEMDRYADNNSISTLTHTHAEHNNIIKLTRVPKNPFA